MHRKIGRTKQGVQGGRCPRQPLAAAGRDGRRTSPVSACCAGPGQRRRPAGALETEGWRAAGVYSTVRGINGREKNSRPWGIISIKCAVYTVYTTLPNNSLMTMVVSKSVDIVSLESDNGVCKMEVYSDGVPIYIYQMTDTNNPIDRNYAPCPLTLVHLGLAIHMPVTGFGLSSSSSNRSTNTQSQRRLSGKEATDASRHYPKCPR